MLIRNFGRIRTKKIKKIIFYFKKLLSNKKNFYFILFEINETIYPLLISNQMCFIVLL